MTRPPLAVTVAPIRRLFALFLALVALLGLPSGCVVNPVPTPSSAGGSLDNDNQKVDAGKASDTELAGGAGDSDSAMNGAADASATSDADGSAAADSDTAGQLPGDADGGQVECCPLDPPGCDCVSTGGTKGPQGCIKICDAAPVGWKKLIDANGCPYWQTGPQSCMIAPVKCADNPSSFPSFTKFCQSDADCDYVVHQTDCCGNATAIGVWKEVKSAFEKAESECRGQYPGCGCPAMPPKGEDGNTSAKTSFGVACKSAQCMTFVVP